MHTEDNFLKRWAELSPAKQALLEKRLRPEPMHEASSNAIPRRPQEGTVPLSFAQQRLWFLQQLEPESTVYNEAMAIRLKGPLHVEALTRAAQEIMRRHEVLRSTFPIVAGQTIQVIDPSLHVDLSVPLIDLRGVPQAEREAEVQRRTTQEVQRPFHLTEEIPWRRALLQIDEEEHVALNIMHHIITDAWSMEVFVHELTNLYAAFCADQPSSLPELTLQYADYAHWQRQWLQGGILDTQLVYWKRKLGGALPVLELPTDRPRPTVQTYHGRRCPLALPGSLSQALQGLSRQEGVTLFMLLLAAFKVWLHRYSGQEDLLVGSPIANRTRPELEDLLGCFVNTLVLRTDLSGNPTFGELVQRVREVTLQAYDHQDVPFEKLVEELQPARNLRYSPLFQVMFVLQNVPLAAQDLSGLVISPFKLENTTAKFDLSLCLQETEQGLSGYLEYNTDLFEASSIERMLGHFQRLLEAIVADPTRRLADLPLLSEAEQQLLLLHWNATQTAAQEPLDLLTRFEAQVARSPQAMAARCGEQWLSYQQLHQQASQLTQHLQAHGVGRETLVGLLAERGLPLLSAILAVFKAGGAYLPLDPRHPAARLRQIVQHSRCPLVLASSATISTLEHILQELPGESRPQVLLLEELLGQEPGAASPVVPAHPRQLAYVIYTSGSSGAPKGVMVEQAGMLNHLQAKISALQLSAADRVAQTASQCFDISVWQLLAALLVGGEVHILPDEVAHDPARLLQQIEGQHLSVLETVPSLLRALLDTLEAAEQGSQPDLAGLRWLMPTGEALPTELGRRWLRLYPHVPLVNAYGPTECSDDVTHHFLQEMPEERAGSVPIGRPIANTQLYVLDARLRPVPIGVNGQLYVGGVGVGRGYLAEAGRTAEAFGPDPFSGVVGARLYRTGDVARYRADGTLEFLGRLDQQVKLRGYRIELGEIEAVLRQQAGVRDCVVLLREDVPDTPRLVAYVVTQPEQSASVKEWQRAVGEVLPEYMLPSAYVLLDALPRTPNGKLDRLALPAPSQDRSLSETAYVAPRTPIEAELATIWSQLLGLERVGIHDNFFEVGGHSLLITQIIARLRDVFQVELPLRVLFKSPTVAELSSAIERVKARSDELRKPSVTAISRDTYRLKRSSLAGIADSSRTKTEG